MLVYTPFALCFVTLRGVFMHFLELTYQRDATVPVPYFCCFCVSEKLHRKYSRNWTKQKPKFIFFPKCHGVKSKNGGAPEGGHTTPWRGPPGRDMACCGPLAHLLTPPFRLYIPLDGKTWRARSIFHETYCKPPPSSMRDREGPKALLGTLPERGITARALLHHHCCLQSDVWVVYLGLRVHSSSYMVVISSMCFMFRSCELPIMIKIIVV
jgi:hypothetical protein